AEDDDEAAPIAVEGDAAVELVGDVEAGLAPDAANRVAADRHGEDASRLAPRLLRGVDDGDPAGLSPAADGDLRLDGDPPQLARPRRRRLGGARQPAGRDGDAGPGELLLRLVLEELHGRASLSAAGRAGRPPAPRFDLITPTGKPRTRTAVQAPMLG